MSITKTELEKVIRENKDAKAVVMVILHIMEWQGIYKV